MSKAVRYPFGFFVGWYTVLDGSCWVFLGMTRRHLNDRQLYRFLVVDSQPGVDPHFESLTSQELFDHVLSPLH